MGCLGLSTVRLLVAQGFDGIETRGPPGRIEGGEDRKNQRHDHHPAGGEGGGRRANELKIYDRTASGNAKPLRIITGVQGGRLTVEPEYGLLFVVAGDHVAVWSIYDEGAAPARFTLGGPKGILQAPRGVTIDLKNKTVIVSDKNLNAVMTFQAPEIFDTAPKTQTQAQARR